MTMMLASHELIANPSVNGVESGTELHTCKQNITTRVVHHQQLKLRMLRSCSVFMKICKSASYTFPQSSVEYLTTDKKTQNHYFLTD